MSRKRALAGVRQGRVITLRVCGGVYFGVLYIVLRTPTGTGCRGRGLARGVRVLERVCLGRRVGV